MKCFFMCFICSDEILNQKITKIKVMLLFTEKNSKFPNFQISDVVW